MNCDNFEVKISLYIDNELNDIEKREFELHLMKCEECRKDYESMIRILKIVREDEQVELPDGYREKRKEKLVEASKKQRKMKNWKIVASIAASLLMLVTSYELIYNNNILNLSKKDSGVDLEKSAEMQELINDKQKTKTMTNEDSISEKQESISLVDEELKQVGEATTDSTANDNNKAVAFRASNTNNKGVQVTRSNIANRKTVKKAEVDIVIEEYDKASKEITDYVNENNGFIESIENIDTESKLEENSDEDFVERKILKIRVPQDKFEQTVNFIKGIGDLNNVNCSTSNVTEAYTKVESSLANLYNRESVLAKILNKVENDEDKQLIKDEISKIKEQVNSYSDDLHEIDDSIMLSTINTILNKNTDE